MVGHLLGVGFLKGNCRFDQTDGVYKGPPRKSRERQVRAHLHLLLNSCVYSSLIMTHDIHNLDNHFHKVREPKARFHPVALPPPENWIPGPRLFPSAVIAGYNADYKKYNADTWAAYILEQAQGFPAATSCTSCSGECDLLGLTCGIDLML